MLLRSRHGTLGIALLAINSRLLSCCRPVKLRLDTAGAAEGIGIELLGR